MEYLERYANLVKEIKKLFERWGEFIQEWQDKKGFHFIDTDYLTIKIDKRDQETPIEGNNKSKQWWGVYLIFDEDTLPYKAATRTLCLERLLVKMYPAGRYPRYKLFVSSEKPDKSYRVLPVDEIKEKAKTD